jgi:hypothetical protein
LAAAGAHRTLPFHAADQLPGAPPTGRKIFRTHETIQLTARSFDTGMRLVLIAYRGAPRLSAGATAARGTDIRHSAPLRL